MDRQRVEYIRAALDDELTTAVQLQAYCDELLTDVERQTAARIRVDGADDQGRTPVDRIAAVRRHGEPVTTEQRARASNLLVDMLTAAELHGATLSDFDWVTDLPAACLDVQLRLERTRP